MELDVEQKLELGDYCDNLLQSGYFAAVFQMFEAHCFVQWQQSQTTSEREATHARLGGAQDLLAHMRAIVADRDNIIAERKAIQEDAERIPGE